MIAGDRIGHRHVGWPLWDDGARIETDAVEVRPRDEDAALGRAHDRAEGTLPFLEPAQERSTRIVITAEEMR